MADRSLTDPFNLRGAAENRMTWPPPAHAARWELIRNYRALEKSDVQHIRDAAMRLGMGGAADAYLVSRVPRLISRTSANFLWGEPAQFRTESASERDQANLSRILRLNRMQSRGHSMSRTTSAQGAALWVVSNDPKSNRNAPVIQFVDEDRAELTFRNVDELVEAKFCAAWSMDAQGDRVRRHFIIHTEDCFIRHELWEGTSTDQGYQLRLIDDPRTADLAASVNEFGEEPNGTDGEGMLVGYIANDRTNDSPFGISDYAGLESHFIAINEALTLGQNDDRHSQKRIIATEELLDANGNLRYDDTVIAATLLDTDGTGGLDKLLKPIEFAFQSDAHSSWGRYLLELTLMQAGIPQESVGLTSGNGVWAAEALEYKMSQAANEMGAKAGYQEVELGEAARMAAVLDAKVRGNQWDDPTATITVELADNLPRDETRVIERAVKAYAAGLMSRKRAVQYIGRNMTAAQVEEELDEIDKAKTAETAQLTKAASDAVAGLTLPPLPTA